MEEADIHEHELQRARSVQMSMLPDIPVVSGVEITASYRACEALGGDFYDFIQVDPWHLGIVMADVSGHGTAAALVMAAAKKVLQLVGRGNLSPRDTILEVNENIRPDVPRGMFLTALYGILDIRKLQLTFVSCGHNHPILRRKDKASDQWGLENAPPLGVVDSRHLEPMLVEKTVQLQPLDVLMLYTDGLTEAFDIDGEMYGEERLIARVERAKAGSAQTMIDAVSNDIDKFRGKAAQSDDETMLVVRVTEHTGKITPLIAVTKDKTELPSWDTAFVGRNEEVKELAKTVREGKHKVITVTGPAGVGKSRVAVTAADSAGGKFYGGTYFVDLKTAKNSADIMRSVSADLEVGTDSTRIGLKIGMALHSSAGRTLLILDNCDGCFSSLDKCISEWQARAKGLIVLATSGRPLGMVGENIVRLNPLATNSDGNLDAESARQIDSVELFLSAALAADPGFQLTDSNANEVAAICRKLDGLPQAIELAAARVALLSPRQVLEKLEQRMDLQSSQSGDTLQSTLALSFDLLSQEEQLAVLLLSCFKDGFQIEAASAALDAVQGSRPEDLVRTLMNNSLLHYEMAKELGGERRFFLFESVRLFGQSKLRENAEIIEYFEDALVDYVFKWWIKEKKTGSPQARKRVEIEATNLLDVATKCSRPALRARASFIVAPTIYANGEQGRAIEILSTARDGLESGSEDLRWVHVTDASLRAAESPQAALDDLEGIEGDSLLQFQVAIARSTAYKALSQTDDAIQVVSDAIKIPGLHSLQKAFLKERLANYYGSIGKLEDAKRGLLSALKVVRENKDKAGEGRVLSSLGWVFIRNAKPAEARVYLEAGLKCAELEQDRSLECSMLGNLALGLHLLGESKAAEAGILRALRISRELGLAHTEATHLNTLCRIYHESGRDHEAMEACEQARDVSREIGARDSEAIAEANLAFICILNGKLDGVLTALENARKIQTELGDGRGVLANLGSVGSYYGALYAQTGDRQNLLAAIENLSQGCEGRREQGFEPMIDAELELGQLLVSAGQRKQAKAILVRLTNTTQDSKDSMSLKVHEQAVVLLGDLSSGPQVRLHGGEGQVVKAPGRAPGSGTFKPVKPRNPGSGVFPPVKRRSGSSGMYSPVPEATEHRPLMTPLPPTKPNNKPVVPAPAGLQKSLKPQIPKKPRTGIGQKSAPKPGQRARLKSGMVPPKKPSSGRTPRVAPPGESKSKPQLPPKFRKRKP